MCKIFVCTFRTNRKKDGNFYSKTLTFSFSFFLFPEKYLLRTRKPWPNNENRLINLWNNKNKNKISLFIEIACFV